MPKKAAGIEKAKGALESKKETLQQVSDLLDKSERLPKEFNKLMSNLSKKNLEGVMSSAIAIIKIYFEDSEKKDEKAESAGKKPKTAPTTAALSGLKDQVKKGQEKDEEPGKTSAAPETFDHTKIKSAPSKAPSNTASPEVLIDACLKTTRFNFQQLAPRMVYWDLEKEADVQNIQRQIVDRGYQIKDIIPIGTTEGVKKFYKDIGAEMIIGNTKNTLDEVKGSSKTLFDVILSGNYPRIAAFTGNNGEIYILDPYRNKGKDPILLKDYIEKFGLQIEFIVPIDTTGQTVAKANLETLQPSEKGERITAAVGEALTRGIVGIHCWDWGNQVYNLAGFDMSERKRIFNSVRDYTGKNCGEHHASRKELDKIEPGDWLYINNKNKFDNHGNHSVVFMEWVDKENLIARTASCPGKDRTGVISNNTSFKETPVTQISKPV